MPNILIDHSPVVADIVASTRLAQVLHRAVIDTGVFPTWGIRTFVRAAEESLVADATQDQGFIQIMVRIAPGRTPEVRAQVLERLFDAVDGVLGPHLETRKFGYQLEITEFDKAFTRNRNNLA